MKTKANTKTQQDLFAILKDEFNKTVTLDGMHYDVNFLSNNTQFTFTYKDSVYSWFVNLSFLVKGKKIEYYTLYTMMDLVKDILINKQYNREV